MLSALRSMLGNTLTMLQTRLQLLALELEEERQRILAMLLWGAVAVLALGAGLVFLAVFLTVLLWDTDRLLVLGIFATLFLSLGGIAVFLTLRMGRSASALFSASIAELSNDRSAIRSSGES